ncbi:hypothetical protein ACFXB3_00335 [Streptomyces sp. NPDC059447]|uniref:hypothetical protein n=1 Tax=Streptomyces sp. NPDC059447 TaxID=3346834 RepID=UPI0036ACAFDC
MRPNRLNPARVLLLFLVAVSAWAAWLGWDQHRDVQPDGSVTGPYEAWQVIGLVLTLSAAVTWAALRGHAGSAVLGITAGLTVACAYDWSDDSSGLFALGVVMVMVGTFTATSALSALITHMTRDDGRHGRG